MIWSTMHVPPFTVTSSSPLGSSLQPVTCDSGNNLIVSLEMRLPSHGSNLSRPSAQNRLTSASFSSGFKRRNHPDCQHVDERVHPRPIRFFEYWCRMTIRHIHCVGALL